jgi:hypothetical protein
MGSVPARSGLLAPSTLYRSLVSATYSPALGTFHNRHTNPEPSRGGSVSPQKQDEHPRPDYWWQHLGPEGRPLPPSVNERLRWYEKVVRKSRIGYFVFEIITIVIAAAIPAAAAMGASTATTGILGALVTVMVGFRQLWRWGEDWIRFSGSLVALQREVVAWSVGAEPYNEPRRADALLSTRVESLVETETTRWSALRSEALPSKADADDGHS